MFRLYPEPRRARPTLPAKSVPIPSSSDLCELCVSAFSSPNVDTLDAASSISPLSATLTKNTKGGGTSQGWAKNSNRNHPVLNSQLPALFTMLAVSPERSLEGRLVRGSAFNRFFPNSHGITSFAYPHPLTPIESYSCKNRWVGVPSAPNRGRGASCLCVTHRNPRNSNLIRRLLHDFHRPPGWGGRSATLLCATSAHSASLRYLYSVSAFDFQLLALSLEGSIARPERRDEGSTVSPQLHSQEATQRPFAKNAKIVSYLGGDSVSTEAVAARRHAGTHLPVTWWKLEMPTTTWHLLLN